MGPDLNPEESVITSNNKTDIEKMESESRHRNTMKEAIMGWIGDEQE